MKSDIITSEAVDLDLTVASGEEIAAGEPPASGKKPRAVRKPNSGPRRKPLATWGLMLLLAVLSIPFIFPTWWMITSSFKPMSEILRSQPTIFPENPSFDAFGEVFRLQPFATQYWNSMYIAVLVTVGTMLISAMAGYAFARIKFPGANLMFVTILMGLLLPSEVTIVPLFRMVNSAGLLDTHWPLIVIPMLGAPSALAAFIMRQFFLSLPVELEEAGRMDGLSRWGIFWKIAFPLSKPALSAVAIFTFLKSWNMYLEPIVYLSTKSKFTLPQALTQYVDAYGGPMWNVQLAATSLTVIPVLLVFIFAQKQFVQGLAQTGIKG